MNKEIEIILCDRCKGEGLIGCSECTSYHKGDYDNWTEKCPKCKGSGRMLVETSTQIREKPYATLKPDGSQKKMLERIRKARS